MLLSSCGGAYLRDLQIYSSIDPKSVKFPLQSAGGSESAFAPIPVDTAKRDGGLVLCAAAYAELLAFPGASTEFVDTFLTETDISVDFALDEHLWHEVGQRFARYATRRRASRGGRPKPLLADFVIGTHALRKADRLLTLDPSHYESDFPDLVLFPI